MTKEYRLRLAVASLLKSLHGHGDHGAAFCALRSVNPEAASRLAKACANSEEAAGLLLTMGASDDDEFSVLDRLLVGDVQVELTKLEYLLKQLEKLRSRPGFPSA